MAAELLPNIKQRYWDANGIPLAGAKLYSYEAGTTTPLATYVDQAETTPNANPTIFDANGEADIFITSGVQYKFVLTDANDVVQWTRDNISGVGFTGLTGTGDLVGPASSVNNELALFSGTTGKVLKRASGNGIVKLVNGVIGYITGIDLATETTGVLGFDKGGTGQTTAQAALDALLPSQTGQAGKYIKTDGTNSSWDYPAITQFISSVAAVGSAPNASGATVSGGNFNLEPADATHPGVLTVLAQTIAGVKTFADRFKKNNATGITAFAGGGGSGSTALTKQFNKVTTVASDFDSVVLPAAVVGEEIVVMNTADKILAIFPESGENFQGRLANEKYNLCKEQGVARFTCAEAGVWSPEGKNIVVMGTFSNPLLIDAAIGFDHNTGNFDKYADEITIVCESDTGGTNPISASPAITSPAKIGTKVTIINSSQLFNQILVIPSSSQCQLNGDWVAYETGPGNNVLSLVGSVAAGGYQEIGRKF